MSAKTQRLSLAPLALVLAACGEPPTAPEAPPLVTNTVGQIADDYFAAYVARYPTAPYFSGVPVERHHRLLDNSPEALAAWWAREDALYARLMRIDRAVLAGSTDWVTHGLLQEELEASIGMRACRLDLWGVNQMWGWQLGVPRVAAMQPVDTEQERADALERWASLPGYIDQEIANLRAGLEAGYSAPKAVVRRVIVQMDGMIAQAVEDSPFMDPARRAGDPDFTAALDAIVREDIALALLRYRDFLLDEYLAGAREALAVTANPDGRACYEASLRNFTTMQRSPEDVYELGQRTVDANRERVVELGTELYGIADFVEIVRTAREDPTQTFESADELLAFARAAAERSRAGVADWFAELPERGMIVEPYPTYLDGTGVSDRYEAGAEDRPGIYRIGLASWVTRSRGNAEVTVFHEGYPGHHLQIAIAQEIEGMHPIAQMIFNSGFGEGWARYSEDLAERAGMYTSPVAPILRRAWPARGMVVDPGIHVMGWTREQARDFMIEAGRFPPERADDMVDRIAILPGQLTAYDSGALEMWALRDQAQAALGDGFDVREFHSELLRNGTVPLPLLREHIERWIASRTSDR